MAKRHGDISERFADRIGQTVRRVETRPYSDGISQESTSDRADEFGIFEVTAEAELSGYEWKATAKWVTFDEDAEQYSKNGDLAEVTLYFPTAQRNTDDEADGHAEARIGQWLFSIFRGRWEVLGAADDDWEWGKLDGSLSEGSSATVSLWRWNGSALVDSTVNVTAHDWLLESSGSIASGKKVKVEFHGNARRWYVTAAECN